VGCGSSPCERGAREQGMRDEDLVSIVPHETSRQAIEKQSRTKSIQDRQSEAKTSEVHEEPIKLIIWVSHKTRSTSDREAKSNEVDTRSTKRSADERSIRET